VLIHREAYTRWRFGSRNTPAWFVPTLVACSALFSESQVHGWLDEGPRGWLWSIALGAPGAVMTWSALRGIERLLPIVIWFVYGVATTDLVNRHLDHGSPAKQVIIARVTDLQAKVLLATIPTRYTVSLSPEPGKTRRISAVVRMATFQSLRVGDEVRVEIAPGCLGIPWIRSVRSR
jgi:hypothetical protein